ncbi:hypothetical protein Q6284_33760, partial [Klebsiella pneumoniae]|nr:hypothetical protein [Klebsiella pneumoniae]
ALDYASFVLGDRAERTAAEAAAHWKPSRCNWRRDTFGWAPSTDVSAVEYALRQVTRTLGDLMRFTACQITRT